MVKKAAAVRSGSGREAPVVAEPEDRVTSALAARGGLRASDADRDRVVDVLQAAFAQGRLTRDEFTARMSRALQSRTWAELATVTAGLAAHRPAARRPASRKKVAVRAVGVVVLAALVAAFFTFYGGFIVLLVLAFIATTVATAPPGAGARRRR